MSRDALTDSLLSGNPRAVARALSLVEDGTPEGAALIARIHARTGRAYLVGVTGPPGAGKSTLVDRLIGCARRDGRTVGVIAVDPTSPFTGGAILGDRVRMSAHAGDTGVFIRSMATRGHLGGLARATADLAAVLDAAGADLVIIETVGVGQDEVDIVRTADISIVLLVPGTGDDVQAIKAGIMEIGDVYVVNKADREGAGKVAQTVESMLSLQPAAAGSWKPPVLLTEAHTGRGVDDLWAAILRFGERAGPDRAARTRARHDARLRGLLVDRFLQRVDRAISREERERILDRIVAGELDPYTAAERILAEVVTS